MSLPSAAPPSGASATSAGQVLTEKTADSSTDTWRTLASKITDSIHEAPPSPPERSKAPDSCSVGTALYTAGLPMKAHSFWAASGPRSATWEGGLQLSHADQILQDIPLKTLAIDKPTLSKFLSRSEPRKGRFSLPDLLSKFAMISMLEIWKKNTHMWH